MEILFTNTYVRNKKLAQEIYRYFCFRRRLIIVCYVLMAITFLLNLILLAFGESPEPFTIIFPVVFIILMILSYFSQVNAMIKRDLEVHGQEISVKTIVTDAYIENTASTGSVNQIEYNKIRYAVQTRNLILLRSKANLIYIFRKDTFEVGTKEEFITFLKGKGIPIRGK